MMDVKEYATYIGAISDIELGIRKRAAQVHEDTAQVYGLGHPYFYHLNQVATYVVYYLPYIVTKKEDILPVLFGAYFHDSIEDARLTYNDVKKIALEYMDEESAFLAAEIVYALTNEKGRNRHERANEKYYAGIRAIPYAPLVKAADRLANYTYAKSEEGKESMRKAYEKEMDEFISSITVIGETDPRYTIPSDMIDELLEK